jgi:nicotinamide mononucleotide transporter
MALTGSKSHETLLMAGLLAAVMAVALTSAMMEQASSLEAVSFVTGAACVWITVKENIWNFPIGLANVATFSVVFYRAGLLADAGLQVVYFVLGLMGWYLWLFGGEHRSRLRVTRASGGELLLVASLVAVATYALWTLLAEVGGSASFWDSLTTSISLAAQWLLNRKRLESWLGWILVDVIYVPLYIYKNLYLTAVLYAVFLVMAIKGFQAWRQNCVGRQAALDAGPVVGVGEA